DIIIKSKDVLEQLLKEKDECYVNIMPEGRKSSRTGIFIGLLKRDIRLFNYVKGKNYDMFIGTDPAISHIGFLKKIPVITVLEDDINVIPELALITYPFTSIILTPEGCKTGKYKSKTIHYRGYMELAYLHPRYFFNEVINYKKPFFLIRLSKLNAYHDSGIEGLTDSILKKIIGRLEGRGSIYISSEGVLDESFRKHELRIDKSQIHDVLANASILISDSQSMTMEAAILGIPSLRFSDFAGKISVLEELEHKYGLTYGIPTNKADLLFQKLDELLAMSEIELVFQKRRKAMLKDKIDVTAFMVWFIENYPVSFQEIKKNPEFQNQF
ncbi:MAG: hypothetical protein RQ866_08155, partial [Bacteroidales bacterium]|nr:hypothetical protein [Bacteroidales bacterium]